MIFELSNGIFFYISISSKKASSVAQSGVEPAF